MFDNALSNPYIFRTYYIFVRDFIPINTRIFLILTVFGERDRKVIISEYLMLKIWTFLRFWHESGTIQSRNDIYCII
jgi:hypothetical protein